MKLKKPLPKWAPLAGIVVGGLLVIGMGWMAVISPQDKKAASLSSQAATVQQQIQTQLAAVAAAKQSATQTAPEVKVANVYKLAQAMPSTPDIPDLFIELTQLVKDAGVTLQTLSPQPVGVDPTTGDTSVPISLSALGNFYTVTDLLYRLRNFVWVRDGALEANGRLFNIDNVTLAPQGKNQVVATLTLHAFVYTPPAPAAPAVPALPATTGTDTTSTDTTQTATTPDNGASAAGAGG